MTLLGKVLDKIIKVFYFFIWRCKGLKIRLKDLRFIQFPFWIDRPKNIQIGSETTFGPYVYVTCQNDKGYLRIGYRCEINPFSVFLCGNGIEIGNHVLLSPGVKIITSTNTYEPNWLIASNPHIGDKVIIEDNVYIGTGVIILPGIKIGSGSVVGAGALVTKDVPPGVVAYGMPCRVVKKREVNL